MNELQFESDVALGELCMDVLVKNVGLLETERFIAYLSRERADYTKWRQNQFEDLSLEELGRATRESGEFVRSTHEFHKKFGKTATL
ncbi:MAG: hypothetical protein IKH04_07490 [Kiritimatiellae bacterium]|jgi:hypothetical protein|nr:hypothetical protein [Kiritimatiellia bacterium]